MLDLFCGIVSFITPIIVLFVPRYKATYEICRQLSDMPRSLLTSIKCFIPIYNGYLARKILHRKAPVYKGFSIWCLLVAILILLARTVFNANVLVNFVAVICVYITVILIYAFGVYMNIDICNIFDCRNLIKVCVVVPPLGTFMLDKRIRMFCKENADLINNTFGGDDDDDE